MAIVLSTVPVNLLTWARAPIPGHNYLLLKNNSHSRQVTTFASSIPSSRDHQTPAFKSAFRYECGTFNPNKIDAFDASKATQISRNYVAEPKRSVVGSSSASHTPSQNQIPEGLLPAADTAPQHPYHTIDFIDPIQWLEQEGSFYRLLDLIAPISDEPFNEEAQIAAAQQEQDTHELEENQVALPAIERPNKCHDEIPSKYGDACVDLALQADKLPSEDAPVPPGLEGLPFPCNDTPNVETVAEAEDRSDDDLAVQPTSFAAPVETHTISPNGAHSASTLLVHDASDITLIHKNNPAAVYASATPETATNPGLDVHRASPLIQDPEPEDADDISSDKDIPLREVLRRRVANKAQPAPSLPVRKPVRPRTRAQPSSDTAVPGMAAQALPPRPTRTRGRPRRTVYRKQSSDEEDEPARVCNESDDEYVPPQSNRPIRRPRGRPAHQNAEAGPSQPMRKRGRCPSAAKAHDDAGGAVERPSKRVRTTRSTSAYPKPRMHLTQTEPVLCPLECGFMLPANTLCAGMACHIREEHGEVVAPSEDIKPCPFPGGCVEKYKAQVQEAWRTKDIARHVVQSHIGIVSFHCPVEGCSYKSNRADVVGKHIKKARCHARAVAAGLGAA
ncbi:hypothetical protein PHLGIDRAFT_122600 [Phlebiopsis gigantea 11061_1 CR5-6]|uniref:Uncharacterized protein n=1 Tax=Phlebiopsis gigantea (strain 11061_1 CR5-6) TaxID=745531 RepID=A0A0C3RQU6_PHLG1|nr:hypothetical protein PHLGIDRAFT_122600 [Phlebiopsis gigantea 11061_1 CR5-6]